jgi:hypothetical protein
VRVYDADGTRSDRLDIKLARASGIDKSLNRVKGLLKSTLRVKADKCVA